MSISRPFPSHAPAAISSSGYTVMSWHASVIGVGPQLIPDGCCGVCGSFWSPLTAPVAGSLNSRGSLTTAAFCGRGDRHLDDLDPPPRRVLAGRGPGCSVAAGQLGRGPDAGGALDVDVDVVPVVLVGRPACACASRGTSARRPTCTGASRLLMSKIRTPWKRVRASTAGVSVQSILPRVSSTDMNSRLRYTDTSPCPPGQTTDVRSFGAPGFAMLKMLKPLKLPTNALSPSNAMSELRNPKLPGFAGSKKPCGFVAGAPSGPRPARRRRRSSRPGATGRRADRRWSAAAPPPSTSAPPRAASPFHREPRRIAFRHAVHALVAPASPNPLEHQVSRTRCAILLALDGDAATR